MLFDHKLSRATRWQRPRLTIHTKLFLTLFAVAALVAAGLFLFMQRSFERGFADLVTARQEQRIQRITDRLADRYVQDGGWQRLRSDRSLWLGILLERGPPPPWNDEPPDRPPHHRGWAHRLGPDDGLNWPPEPLLNRFQHDARPPPLELRLMLVDADGGILYGRPELLPDTRRFAIDVDGATVGQLALLPGPSLADTGDTRFLQHQTSAFLLIALAMIALSAVLSLPLAKRLVRPVRTFRAAARALAAGDYTARVPIQSDDELGQLGRDLNGLATALERNEQARRRWVADISHELRTPLALLRAELEALQDGVRPLEPATVDSLHADVLRLGHLVDDLYELSMTDLGALTYHKTAIDPAALLVADVAAGAPAFAEAGLTVTFENRLPAPVLLEADGHRLSQLFRNLLQNSLRYTDAGGSLAVILDRDGDRLLIDFQDTAPGVPEEALPRLFDRLYRVDGSRHRATGGAGLGLAICRNIAEAHAGALSARPSPHGGLWIRVELPLQP